MRLATVWLCVLLLQQCSSVSEGKSVEAVAGRRLPEAVGSSEQPAPTELPQNLPVTVSWILFGGVVMIMSAFYFVNYRDKDISDATWLVISNAISLFCAVLLFLAFRDLIALATDGDEIRRRLGPSDDWGQCWDSGSRRLLDVFRSRRLAGPPTQITIAADGFCMLAMVCIWEAVLFFVRKKSSLLSALGLIAGHCIGFSTLYAFGNMQQCEPFRDTPGLSVLIVIAMLVASKILFQLGECLRHRIVHKVFGHTDESHDVHNWLHQCHHTEMEAVAFACSFLVAQVLGFLATEGLAPLHHVPKGRDPGDAALEFSFIAALSVLVICAGYAEQLIAAHHGHHDHQFPKHGHEMTRKQLAMHMVKDTLAFTAGWSMLNVLKLIFWSATNDEGLLGGGDVMTSHIVMVFISSAVTFLTFFAIDFAADRIHGNLGRGLRSLGKAFMLLLGLTWEGAFWEGAHTMSQGMGFENQTSRMLMVVLLSLILCAIVMPAWIIHIVPHTFEEEGEELHVKDYDEHVSPAGSSSTPKSFGLTSRGLSGKCFKTLEASHDKELRLGNVSPSVSPTQSKANPATAEEEVDKCLGSPEEPELLEVCVAVEDSKAGDIPDSQASTTATGETFIERTTLSI